MKKIVMLAALLALSGCASYHQSHKGAVAGKDEAAARAAVYGSAEKTAKAHKAAKVEKAADKAEKVK